MKTTIPVSEIFLAVQGEGMQIGRPTVFVRTGGCDFRCSWCDSMYAVDPKHKAEWKPMTPTEILDTIDTITGGTPILITLSGGNPAIHNFADFCVLAKRRGHTLTMETQGSKFAVWMNQLDFLCLSPKPPSSGMENKFNPVEFEKCLSTGFPSLSVKIVVFDETDLAWALDVFKTCPSGYARLYLQAGNNDVHTADQNDAVLGALTSYAWLERQVLKRKLFHVTVLPQLHVLVHGNKRGV